MMVVMVPSAAEIRRIRLLPRSATIRLPEGSTSTPLGVFNWAAVA
jgi:hypothetical protein